MQQSFDLNSKRGIKGALVALDFPVISDRIFPALAALESEHFKSCLSALVQSKNPAAPSKELSYMKSMTSICSEAVCIGLERMEIGLNPELMVELGRSNGLSKMFRNAFDPALKGDAQARNTLAIAMGEANRSLTMWKAAQAGELGTVDVAPAAEDNQSTPEAAPPMPRAANSSYQQEKPSRHQDAAPPARMDAEPQAAASKEASKYGPSYHVYGGKGAICFQVSIPRGSNDEWSIHIEGASGSNRRYDWASKINIRFNSAEIPLFLCVLLGFRKSLECTAHGAQNEKSFSIENQGDKFFVKVRAGQRTVAVPMTLGDSWWVGALFFSFLTKMSNLSEDSVMRLLKITSEQANNASKNDSRQAA